MTNRHRRNVRPCNHKAAHSHPQPIDRDTLKNYQAHMAVDCIITLALFKTVPWLEIQITRAVIAALGSPLRHSCVCGTAIRLTRERAQSEGWPWPSLDEVIATQMEKGGAR